MEVSTWFIVIFVLMWLAGPLTQVLFLIAPKLHHKIGLTEADALKPEFKWFLLDERAIAYADLTYFLSGITFVVLVLQDDRSALVFGLYSCACYVYVASLAIPRWLLLGKHGISPLPAKQLPVYFSYMIMFMLFGLYGLYYLWGLTQP
ncbi:MAG: hypothetical protein HKP12_16520 [Gammaproteobacteria bacterium]|nr:hypothetical protein [Gammaproteobacteria bacterium]